MLASMVNSLLHESAHAVAGLALGLTPTILPFAVDFAPGRTTSQQVFTAAAGPLFSLVMGLVLMSVARSWGRGIVRLFWMWLAFMGVMNFAGYCFIAPFARAGDTGRVLELLNAPLVVSILVGLIGAAGVIWLARRFAIEVKRYAVDITTERQLAFHPWLLGTPIIIAMSVAQLAKLDVPIAALILILMYNVAFGVFAPMQFNFRTRVHNTYQPLVMERVSVVGLGVTVAVGVFSVILAGVGGLTLG
ncbi:MAG TPA: hypothetical protein VF642_03845 [Propionibacteriaceae bacterium]